MKRIDISIPSNIACDVIGFIYTSDDAAELGEDMLEVQFDNGCLLDAGWYPEGDPNGEYVISVTHGLSVEKQYQTKSIQDAVDHIQRLIPSLAQPYIKLSHSNVTYGKVSV